MASTMKCIAGQTVRIFHTRGQREVELVAVLPENRALGLKRDGRIIGVLTSGLSRFVCGWDINGGSGVSSSAAETGDLLDLVDLPPYLAVTPAPDGFPLKPDVDAGEFASGGTVGTQPMFHAETSRHAFDFPGYDVRKIARRELLEELVGPIMKQMVGPVERKNDVVLSNIEARIIVAALREAGYGDQNP